jgi:hypothetical protein
MPRGPFMHSEVPASLGPGGSPPRPSLDLEDVPSTGVRRVARAREREAPVVAWGAVLAGGLVAVGVEVLVELAGAALGWAPPMRPVPIGLTFGAGFWPALSAVVAFFVGGYAAASLAPPVAGSGGVLVALLAWAATVAFGVSVASGIASAAPGGPEGLRAAWAAFGEAACSVVAAALGGRIGAAGGRLTRRQRDRLESDERDRAEAVRIARERDREAMRRDSFSR